MTRLIIKELPFFFQNKKPTFLSILVLPDEQEKEETRQMYEELHSNVEVSATAW